MSDDGYGTDVALGPNGDFIITPAGDVASLNGPLNCAQAMLNRLRTTPGELPLHPAYGSTVADLIGSKLLDESLAAAHVTNDLRTLVNADRRFSSAQASVLRGDANGGSETIKVEVGLGGGEQLTLDSIDALSDVSLDELDVSAPPTLTDLTADLDPALTGLEALVDPDSDLPELADLIGAQATDPEDS